MALVMDAVRKYFLSEVLHPVTITVMSGLLTPSLYELVRIIHFPNIFIRFICICMTIDKIIHNEHINKQAIKVSNFRLF